MNGWKDVDKLSVTLIKPYEFVMEYIYKRNMSGIDLLIDYITKRNDSVKEFDSTELYELLDYTNQTLMLQDDMKLTKIVFDFILKHFEQKKDYTPQLLKMVLICLQIKFKVPNKKLDEIVIKLKDHLSEYLNKLDMTSIELDENDFEYLLDKLTFEMSLYQSFVLANTKQNYKYLNKIDPNKIKEYMLDKPRECVMEQFYELYDEESIRLLLNCEKNIILVFGNDNNNGVWQNYPLGMAIKIGKVVEMIDNKKMLRVNNIAYGLMKNDKIYLEKKVNDKYTWTTYNIINISPAFWDGKGYGLSQIDYQIYKNMHVLIEFNDLTDIKPNTDLYIDYRYTKKTDS